MSETPDKDCAFFGEGVTFSGSVSAADRIVIQGTGDGDVSARELVVGHNGTIKGNVKVELAEVHGTALDNVEARDCLLVRSTGRIDGSVSYGEIEIEKGGILTGQIRTLQSDETPIAQPLLSFGMRAL